jgi:hypothetical protein
MLCITFYYVLVLHFLGAVPFLPSQIGGMHHLITGLFDAASLLIYYMQGAHVTRGIRVRGLRTPIGPSRELALSLYCGKGQLDIVLSPRRHLETAV